MLRRAVANSPSAAVIRRIRHFGDFVTVPLAVLVFANLAGPDRLHLVVAGVAIWTLIEYLVHRFLFHRNRLGSRLHKLHHDHPSDPDAERSSLSTPLIASPIGFLLIAIAGIEDGSAIFAGFLSGYLVFIAIHYAVHRWPLEPGGWLYTVRMRHMTHHRLETCNYGVTTPFWDIVFRTYVPVAKQRVASN